jgi:hypothetical protein
VTRRDRPRLGRPNALRAGAGERPTGQAERVLHHARGESPHLDMVPFPADCVRGESPLRWRGKDLGGDAVSGGPGSAHQRLSLRTPRFGNCHGAACQGSRDWSPRPRYFTAFTLLQGPDFEGSFGNKAVNLHAFRAERYLRLLNAFGSSEYMTDASKFQRPWQATYNFSLAAVWAIYFCGLKRPTSCVFLACCHPAEC